MVAPICRDLEWSVNAALNCCSGSWGCGAVCSLDWFQLPWDNYLRHSHISVEELTPIVIAAAVWGQKWFSQSLQVRSDNIVTVAAVGPVTTEKQYTFCSFYLSLQQNLSYPFQQFTYLEGIADAFSRNSLILFYSLCPQASHYQTDILAALVELEVDLQTVNQSVECYFSTGLVAAARRKIYQIGQRQYLSFCEQQFHSQLQRTLYVILYQC